MTNKELLQRIRSEIERLYNGKVPSHDQQCDFRDGYFTGIDTISNFLDTLQVDEPKGLDVTDFCKPIEHGIAQCIADHWWEMLDDEESSKPEDLDEAADKYLDTQDVAEVFCGDYEGWQIIDAFKAGAKWMSGQGVTIEKTVGQLESICAGHPTFYHGFEVSELDADFLNSKEVGYDDKVIVQIRKIKENGK